MASTDLVTEGQISALVTEIAAGINAKLLEGIVVVDAGSNGSFTRPSGAACVYWTINNGVTLTTSVEGDLIYERPA